MRAMVLRAPRTALELGDVTMPRPGDEQVVLQVRACGVCRTDLHIVDGELDRPKLPLVLGHEGVPTGVESGPDVQDLAGGERSGVPCLGWTAQTFRYAARGQGTLGNSAAVTG